MMALANHLDPLPSAIVRNGTIDENGSYGYPELGTNGSSGLPHSSYQDLDDPALLLESIANYEHPQPSNDGPISSTDGFASLIQAATQAGAAQTGPDYRIDGDQPENSNYFGIPPLPTTSMKQKRGRTDESYSAFSNSNRKRAHVGSEDEAEQLARECEIWGPKEAEVEEADEEAINYEKTPAVMANARSIGVHSAAALFRRPSPASKKYTRPPMSKLFTSLELTPEQFLHIQAAAKKYMLDKKHPERRDCVGSRGSGDTDMTKLRLFACVKFFLEEEGWGERCFGKDAPGVEQRKLKWPQMKNKIVSLTTPLLRRMVTNERQRLYASQSRKDRSQGKSRKANTDQSDGESEIPEDDTTQPSNNRRRSRHQGEGSHSPMAEIDPKLDQYHYVLDDMQRSEDGQNSIGSRSGNGFPSTFPIETPDIDEVKYLISIIGEGHRLKPRFTLSPETCPGFSSLVQHAQDVMDDGRGTRSIQIHGPSGLIDVNDQASWIDAIELIKATEWMDGEVKCIVQMEEA